MHGANPPDRVVSEVTVGSTLSGNSSRLSVFPCGRDILWQWGNHVCTVSGKGTKAATRVDRGLPFQLP